MSGENGKLPWSHLETLYSHWHICNCTVPGLLQQLWTLSNNLYLQDVNDSKTNLLLIKDDLSMVPLSCRDSSETVVGIRYSVVQGIQRDTLIYRRLSPGTHRNKTDLTFCDFEWAGVLGTLADDLLMNKSKIWNPGNISNLAAENMFVNISGANFKATLASNFLCKLIKLLRSQRRLGTCRNHDSIHMHLTLSL